MTVYAGATMHHDYKRVGAYVGNINVSKGSFTTSYPSVARTIAP